MLEIKKFVVGIRPSSKMFRIPAIGGLIVDAVLARRGVKPLSDEYYSEITTNYEKGALRLQNKELGNVMRIDLSNVLFMKDASESGRHINIDKALLEFEAIWGAVNETLKISDVRRIGVFAEYHIDYQGENVNAIAMNLLTKISSPAHPGKFHLRYEDRRPTKDGIAPDIEKSDFVNVIYEYYDLELDSDHPLPGHMGVSVDYQKYYSPLLSKNIWDEVRIQKRKFDTELKSFRGKLKELNLVA